MSTEQAMQEYVSCVRALDPEGSQKVRIKPTVEAIAWWDVKQDSFAVKYFDLLCVDIHKSSSSSPPRQIIENRSELYCFGEILSSCLFFLLLDEALHELVCFYNYTMLIVSGSVFW